MGTLETVNSGVTALLKENAKRIRLLWNYTYVTQTLCARVPQAQDYTSRPTIRRCCAARSLSLSGVGKEMELTKYLVEGEGNRTQRGLPTAHKM